MNIMELKKEIDSGDIKGIYIFHGDEYEILETYIKNISKKLGTYLLADSVLSVYRSLGKKNLFADAPRMIVVRDDKDFISDEISWKDIHEKLKTKNICLIVKYVKLDNRSKFVKHFEERITNFETLSDDVLRKYIGKDAKLTKDQTDKLIHMCGSNYGRIKLELNKLRNVAEYFKLSDEDAMKLCLNSGSIYEEESGDVFDLIDSILTRNVKRVYELKYESERRNDNPLLILSLLHTNVKNVLQIQTLGNNKNAAEITGLTPFQVKNAFRYANRYECKELIRFIRLIKYCDESIKNGSMSIDIVIDYILVNVL